MKKLLLINPVREKSGFLLSKISTFPPLSLAYVAAVTPSGWDVKILDENFALSVLEDADLVGITAFTSNITRAYEIAGEYRKRNIKVIMGGIHASMLPDEALQYADSVVIGEVEDIWGKVIKDFENNSLSRVYKGPRTDLAHSIIEPRRELLHPDYRWNSIQTSRGCPFDCQFCSVSKYLGKEYRQRTTKNVLNELDKITGDYIVFLDDNLIGYSKESEMRAIELFRGMIERNLKKRWWMQTSINAAKNEQLIELAARSGCMYAFIGFEAISDEHLKAMKKGVNLKIGVENYKEVVKIFHKYGIAVLGAFIVGNDDESPSYYNALANFIIRSGIDAVQISILTPLPGTKLMEQLQKEGRLTYENFPEDWEKYRFSYVVHQPNGVSSDVIYTGNNYIKNATYRFPTYHYRILRSLVNLKNLPGFYSGYKANQAYKRAWRNSHYFKDYPIDFESQDI
jgi:radical SAM superfamily enzyme YgiQ (UPF0313 family)